MLKNCDECGKSFDVFNEGNVSNYNVTLCGNCWSVELKRRHLGGVFTREAK
jgi:predicted nucleic acid-binding Zn ribbon protein